MTSKPSAHYVVMSRTHRTPVAVRDNLKDAIAYISECLETAMTAGTTSPEECALYVVRVA